MNQVSSCLHHELCIVACGRLAMFNSASLSTTVDGAMDSRLGCPRSSCAEDDGLASLDIVARAGRRRLVVHDGVGGEVCIWLLMV